MADRILQLYDSLQHRVAAIEQLILKIDRATRALCIVDSAPLRTLENLHAAFESITDECQTALSAISEALAEANRRAS